MFKLDLSETYKWSVQFTTVDANGLEQKHEIKLIFKRFNREALIKLNAGDEADRPANATPEQIVMADVVYLAKFIEGWEGVEIDGDSVFSTEKLRQLLSAVPGMNTLITRAFMESSQGGFVRKN